MPSAHALTTTGGPPDPGPVGMTRRPGTGPRPVPELARCDLVAADPARPTAVSCLVRRISVSSTVSSAITSAVRALHQRRPAMSIKHPLHSGIRDKSALSLIYDDCTNIGDYVPDMYHLNSANPAFLPAVLRLD
jgi:hypothetical protein